MNSFISATLSSTLLQLFKLIEEHAKDIAIQVLSVVASIVLCIIAWRLGIRTERRREYNELAEPFFHKVNTVLSSESAHAFALDDGSRNALRRRMRFMQRLKFDAALEEYDRAAIKTYQDESGQVFFADVDAVNAALMKIAAVLKRK